MNAGSTRPGVGPIGFSDMGLTTRRVRRGGDGFDKEEAGSTRRRRVRQGGGGFDKEEAGSTGEDGFDKEEVGSTGEDGFDKEEVGSTGEGGSLIS